DTIHVDRLSKLRRLLCAFSDFGAKIARPFGFERSNRLDVTSADFAVDRFDEVFAGLDLVDIDEDLTLAKVRGQPIVKATSIGCGVFTAIVDEDLRVHVARSKGMLSARLFYRA